MKIAAYICFAIVLAAVSSAFLWAAFDVAWWAPMAERQDGRAAVLVMLHAVGGAFCAVAGCYLMAHAES